MRHGVEAAGVAFCAAGGIDRHGGAKKLRGGGVGGGWTGGVSSRGAEMAFLVSLKVLCLFVALFCEGGHAPFVAAAAGKESGERVAEESGENVGGCVCA